MTLATLSRPESTEYAPNYSSYVDAVPDGDLATLLRDQVEDTVNLLCVLTDEQSRHRYAPGKWSIKEVVGHLSDVERIFAYRALCFARGDGTPLPGFDENEYVRRASLDARPLAGLLAELRAVRGATVQLFRGLTDEELMRRGMANGKPFTVRAIAWIVAGHERHHAAVLRERYLAGADEPAPVFAPGV